MVLVPCLAHGGGSANTHWAGTPAPPQLSLLSRRPALLPAPPQTCWAPCPANCEALRRAPSSAASRRTWRPPPPESGPLALATHNFRLGLLGYRVTSVPTATRMLGPTAVNQQRAQRSPPKEGRGEEKQKRGEGGEGPQGRGEKRSSQKRKHWEIQQALKAFCWRGSYHIHSNILKVLSVIFNSYS